MCRAVYKDGRRTGAPTEELQYPSTQWDPLGGARGRGNEMFNLNCQRIEQWETIKNSCSLIKKLEWKSKGKPQSDLCAGKARGWQRGEGEKGKGLACGIETETGTCYNPSNDKNKHTPLASTIYSWKMGWDWGMRRKDRDYRRDRRGGFGVGRFMLHLENILALGDAVQRHAASEGISCQLWLRFVMLTMLKCCLLSPFHHSCLFVVYFVGNAGRKEKLAIERRLLISLPHIV